MKIKKGHILILILIAAFIFRLYFAFQTPNYSDGMSYYNLRYVDHIKQKFTPMFYDPLSFGGREVRQIPIYNYLLAGLSFIPYAYKIIPSVLIILTVLASYFLALRLTDDHTSALFSALIVAFIPAMITPVLNKISVMSLMLPLSFYMIYCLIKIEETKFLNHFIALCIILPLIHPIALLITISLFAYIILIIAEPELRLSSLKKEAIIFSIFLALLINFILFKKAFLALGLGVIWQNIPSQVLAEHFLGINLLDVVYSIGLIPFILGVTGVIFGIMKDKSHPAFIMASIIISPLLFIFLKLISLEDALIFLGAAFAVISAISIKKFFRYLKITKFARFEMPMKILFFFLIIITIIIPSYSTSRSVIQNTITNDEINVLKTLREETDADATILSTIEEGHYITSIAQRKNVMDNNFLYVHGINSRYEDVKEIYTTISSSKALELLHKYDIGYIYLSQRTEKQFGIKELAYASDENCFRKVASSGSVKAYKVRC